MLSPKLPESEWDLLLEEIAKTCNTETASERVKKILPNLDQVEIKSRWGILTPLKQLIGSGYRPPLGELPPIKNLFKTLSMGGLLDAEELRDVLVLLDLTRSNHQFCRDFKAKCEILQKFASGLFPIPKMIIELEKAIDVDGKIKDDASKNLKAIRAQKRHLATRIQNKIKSLLHDQEIEQYLQDDFFTIRNDRYVIPMRLDGHGRIKGNVIDTSGSGQTLFLEPREIAESNQKLQDLESEERLEVLKILRDLSSKLSGHVDELSSNYETIIEFDFFTAQAKVFSDLGCNEPEISEARCIDLIDSFHPILKMSSIAPVTNCVALEPHQSCLVISGPNAGGKTVVLKTIAFCHLMAKSGFLIPAAEDSKIFLFDQVLFELGDGQSLTQSLSSFSSHLYGLKPILESASVNDLVLIDEIAIGTEPNVGAAIGQATLENLTSKKIITVVTTHFEKLKILAIENKNMRNASMEYSRANYSATYRLILDVPGQSYGLELAQKIGIPQSIIDRAQVLSGQNTSELDKVIAEVLKIKQTALNESKALKEEKLEAEKQKNRWEHEVNLLQETRKKAAEKIKVRFEQQFLNKLDEIDEAKKEIKKSGNQQTTQTAKSNASKKLSEMKKTLSELDKFTPDKSKTPGFELTWNEAELGMSVYVVPLEKSGVITKFAKEKELIEVQVGLLKVRPKLNELRRLKILKGNKPTSKKNLKKVKNQASEIPQTIIQTSSNSVNLRGMNSDEAVTKALSFIDSGLLKGEKAIFLIHGHGTSALKTAIRETLNNNCPYDIKFRSGNPEEGGDGVTVVFFK